MFETMSIKKYLKALQKELNAFDLRRTYPRLLILGCLMRQLTECVVNLWCFNLGLLPTDAPLVDDYIDLRTALLNLQYVAENSTKTAFGKSSLTTDVINTLFELKNTSNAFMHVDAEAIDIANLKKHGEALNGLAAKITNQCSPYALELKLDSSKQDGAAVKVTLLCGLFGWLGVHHFYAKNIFRGILFLLTFGLGGLGTLYNLNQLRSGAFFSQKWGTLAKTRWSTVLAVLFMALHIYLIGLLLFPS